MNPSPPNSPRDADHTRLTLVEMLLLTAGQALGFATMRAWRYESAASFRVPLPWPANATVIEMLAAGAIIGMFLSGPIVLGFRYGWLRVRERPTIGEWLWIAPFFAFVFAWPAAVVLGEWLAIICVLSFLTLAVICSLMAVAPLLTGVTGHPRPPEGEVEPPAPWTNRFGALSAMLFGLWLLYLFLGAGWLAL